MAAPSQKLERTLMEVRKNQRQWTEVPTMSGEDLFQLLQQRQQQLPQKAENQLLDSHSLPDNNSNNNTDGEDFVLIDVRSQAERKVSAIAHSITLQEYYQQYPHCRHRRKNADQQRSTTTSASTTNNEPPNLPGKVILYCTIGYRSGMEATHLLHQDALLQGRIYNMAGIVEFSHALAQHAEAHTTDVGRAVDDGVPTVATNTTTATCTIPDNHSVEQQQPQQPSYHRTPTMEMLKTPSPWSLLVDPQTKLETRVVHTFGATWDLCPDDAFETRHFSNVTLICHLLQLLALMLVRFLQRLAYYVRQALKRSSSSSVTPPSSSTQGDAGRPFMAPATPMSGDEVEVTELRSIPHSTQAHSSRPFVTSSFSSSQLRVRSNSSSSVT